MHSLLSSFIKSWKRNKAFLIVNITGLAIGLTVSILLLLYVMNECSYDRHFDKKDRIVQLNTVFDAKGGWVEPICTRTAYTDLPQNIPGIEKAVQFFRGFEVEVIRKPERFQNVQLLYSDPEFFDLFDMKFIYGTAANALINPNSAVLTRPQAEAIFGKANPIGQTILLKGSEYMVTAVVEKLPNNTHFSFDILASMKSLSELKDLGGCEFFTYYLLKSNVPTGHVCELIRRSYTNILTKRFSDSGRSFDAITEPLTRIHLFSKAGYGLSTPGSFQSVLLLSGLAFLILLLAITNFVNLFVAQGNNRSSEVGIRKTNGAGNREISKQFFGEAATVVIISFIIGICAAIILRPWFSSLIGRNIEPFLFCNPVFIVGWILLILFTIMLSAGYPAFYLSRLNPVDILKKTSTDRSKKSFTTSVVVFQSVITIVLIAIMLTVNKQISYLKNIPSGYNPKNVMVVFGANDQLKSHYDALKQELKKVPGVKMVSSAQHLVGQNGSTSGEDFHRLDDNSHRSVSISEYRVLPELCEVMDFKLKNGRFFKENDYSNNKYIVLNEEAVKMLGFQNPVPIGEKVVMNDNPKPLEMEVIGVVKNFYYGSTVNRIPPIAIRCSDEHRLIYIRFDSTIDKAQTAQLILPVFHKFDPDFALNAAWCDDIYDGKFGQEKMVAKIIFAGTLLSLIIAVLGLFAIHAFTVSRRIKEIGIRKISGSTTLSVVALLSGKVLLYTVISAVIALPVAWMLGQHWLESYSNRIHIGLMLLLIPVVIQLFIALLATFMVSWRAATRNPVEVLRYE